MKNRYVNFYNLLGVVIMFSVKCYISNHLCGAKSKKILEITDELNIDYKAICKY